MIDATERQNSAADPDNSTWLSANAGSGKTRVLTDRVARLLLRGVEPQNVLCLTYTKAAASEMQNRLFTTLGSWAMLADGDLREKLVGLGEQPPESLQRARTLFAGAIEAPGGLKIQTIHSFCSSVLRQFPLEAGVPPQFRELDDGAQSKLIEGVLDDLARKHPDALAGVARFYSENTLVELGLDVAKHGPAFGDSAASQVLQRFYVPAGQTEDAIINAAISSDDLAFLKQLAPMFARSGTRDKGHAKTLAALPDMPNVIAIQALESVFLDKKRFEPKIGSVPNKELRESTGFAPHVARLEDLMRRVADAREKRFALRAAQKTIALNGFAQAFLPAYQTAKTQSGALDFDDLIQKTERLLLDDSLSWVLYRLDGAIDHILIDEAQDTSPAQWRVIKSIADEITSGKGSREDRLRTVFVVGDKKQSIYSFQGADADGFDRMANTFERQLADGVGLNRHELLHSFRSSPAILNAVDAVFDAPEIDGLGRDVRHIAFNQDKPGRVDLWPLVPEPEVLDEPEWYDPVDRLVQNDQAVVLAKQVADQIKRMIETCSITIKDKTRPVEPKDILVLVRGRGKIFEQIIRACKVADLPIAGADRLKLNGELAVRDLLALLSFLALAEDSLSLAAALKSPLFGWNENDLYGLAQGRKQTHLWAELRDRADEYPETFTVLKQLRDVVDHLRAFELLEMILSRFEGRGKLVGRLGSEAEDGINELLNQALAYERNDVPSLTGFLSVAQSEDIEIKRQANSAGNVIRVMTVHGSKGLESPIVILPDTTPGERNSTGILPDPEGHPVWPVRSEDSPPIITESKELKAQADRKERNRLLYVAMTRAESWLIVCGKAPNKQKLIAESWHGLIEAGLKRAGAKPLENGVLRLEHEEWPNAVAPSQDDVVSADKVMHRFVEDTVPSQLPQPSPRVPSDLGGEKVIAGGPLFEHEALKRGRQIHKLLEHLPDADDRIATGKALLSRGVDQALPSEIEPLIAEAIATLDQHPALFEPDALAEVDIAAFAPSLGHDVFGAIDRLLVRTDEILAVDFKTNVVVPRSPKETPEGLKRQMGAYLEALEAIWSDRPVKVAILWTATAELTVLPHGIVREALKRATTS